MRVRKDLSTDSDFQEWFASESPVTSTEKQLQTEDNRIRELILEEVRFLKGVQGKSPKLYPLAHKQIEVEEWLPTIEKKHIAWVDRLTWRPVGTSDFRRIDPLLVQVNKPSSVPSFNIWGEKSSRVIKDNEPLSVHWNIIKTLVSSAPNDGTVGRQIYFLVLDRNTKTYLGIICISSALFDVKSIHDAIGWDRAKAQEKESKLRNVANGQTIVATRFFGELLRGGKLLALLCTSKEVANAWEEKYGDKLVSLHTTSLYGSDGGTQYDGLEPYLKKLPPHSAQSIKPRNHVYRELMAWMRVRHPLEYWKHFYKKNNSGNLMRDNKTRAITKCYNLLKVDESEYATQEKRGVYNSFFYKNAQDYLCDRITEDELIPADHFKSVAELTELWRFGQYGDTVKRNQKDVDWLDRLPKSDKDARNKRIKRIDRGIQEQSFVKGVVDRMSKGTNTIGELKKSGKFDRLDWYIDLPQLSWDEIENRFFSQQKQNQKPSQVPPVSDLAEGMRSHH